MITWHLLHQFHRICSIGSPFIVGLLFTIICVITCCLCSIFICYFLHPTIWDFIKIVLKSWMKSSVVVRVVRRTLTTAILCQQKWLLQRGEDNVSSEGCQHRSGAGCVYEGRAAGRGGRVHEAWRPAPIPAAQDGRRDKHWLRQQSEDSQVGALVIIRLITDRICLRLLFGILLQKL